MNCLHSFGTEEKPNMYEKVYKNHLYCEEIVTKKILKSNLGQKSIKLPFAIYVDALQK